MICASASPVGIVAEAMRGHGFGPFLGTPCGVLAPLLEALSRTGDLLSVSREENAVGFAAGAALAGLRPVVLMQNSGFGASVNALASLVQPYSIPLFFLISLRGVTPDHTSENAVMGRATGPLLDLLGIAYRRMEPELLVENVAWAARTLADQQCSVALLVPPDLFAFSRERPA